MKSKIFLSVLLALMVINTGFEKYHAEPWTDAQLIEPSELAKIINNPNADQPLIFCIGLGAMIKNSIDMGPAKEKENLEKFKEALLKIPRDKKIVIYCGCCPFVHCPNIRPAFEMLNELHFTNQKLLNIRNNLKTDWVDSQYPVQKL